MTVKQSTISVVAAVAFVLMALMLAGSVYFINGAVTSQKRATDARAEATQLGSDLENASRYLSNQVRKFAVSGKAEHLDNYWKEVDVTRTGEKVVASLKALGITPEELALINLSNQKSLALTDTETRAMRLVLESQGVAEAKMPKEVAAFRLNELDQKLSGSEKVVLAGQILFDGAYDQGEAAVMQPIADFQSKMEARLNQEVEAAAATTAMGITALIFLAVLVPLGMAIVLGIFHFKSGQPVVAYIKALHGRDANDRSFALNPAGTKELHALAEAFNDQFQDNQRQLRENEELVENLTALVQRVVDNAERLGEASAQLSAASEQAGAATQQIATTIQEVARGNQDTSASAQETSASVEQLARAIDQIARGSQDQVASIEKASLSLDQLNRSIALVAGASRQLASSGEQTAVAANSGTETVKKSARGMEAIRDGSATATSKVQELEKHSEQIGMIVEAIDDIAEQTNLLALNAAIEAARAGEHGRGFAVVADEVRKLAERSSRETKQIATLIAQVQRGTQEAVAAMERGALEVEAGTRLAEETSLALQNILTAVGVANGQVTEIVSAVAQMEAASREVVALMDSVSAVVEESTAATQEMAASSQHVRGAIEKVAAVSEETSASAEEVSASTEEMSAQVEEMVAQSQDLAKMAEELQAAVAQFKKGQGDSEQFSVSMRRRKSDWDQPGIAEKGKRAG